MKCSVCGREGLTGRFCPSCGNPVVEDAPVVETVAEEVAETVEQVPETVDDKTVAIFAEVAKEEPVAEEVGETVLLSEPVVEAVAEPTPVVEPAPVAEPTPVVVPQPQAQAPYQYQYQQPYQAPAMQSNENTIPPEYKPLSPWAYFGYNLLFSLPIAGLVLLIVFSFNRSNLNRRNYARSFFCALIIVAVAAAVVGTIALLIALLAGNVALGGGGDMAASMF